MNLHEQIEAAMDDLTIDERLAFYPHLVGGLVQSISDGRGSKKAAAGCIERAREWATRDRVRS